MSASDPLENMSVCDEFFGAHFRRVICHLQECGFKNQSQKRKTEIFISFFLKNQEKQFGGPEFQKVKAALASTHAVYLSLQELYVNFGNIILPEAVKNIQLGEPSVLSTLSALDQLIASMPQPMKTVQNQMQRLLTNVMFGIEVRHVSFLTPSPPPTTQDA